MKIKIFFFILVILMLLTLSCTKTVIIDDKDDYIECVNEGVDSFKFYSEWIL